MRVTPGKYKRHEKSAPPAWWRSVGTAPVKGKEYVRAASSSTPTTNYQ